MKQNVSKELGLNAKEAIDEKDLENALIKHLQDFILELGKGFCFEERHKRILIDDEYYFADKENEMQEGDNPPIGILLCTQKGKKWLNML